MKIDDPATWNDISNHPTFAGGRFDANWYDGDMGGDLKRLRSAAAEILRQHPRCKCELLVLDDCTMYVKVETEDACLCAIYPAQTDDFEPCYYLDVEGENHEIRVNSVEEVLAVLDKCANAIDGNLRA